jgi:hypothetical protein
MRGVATHLPNQKAKEKGTYAQKETSACVRACVQKKSVSDNLEGRTPEGRFLLGIASVMVGVLHQLPSRCVRVHTHIPEGHRDLKPSRTSMVTGLDFSGV